MSGAKERLSQLLALAAERRWTPLARELCDLVLYWPSEYPAAMRTPILALFETALRQADGATQGEVASRLGGQTNIPIGLMNALYLAAPAAVRHEILARNEEEGEDLEESADSDAVLAVARKGARDFAGALAQAAQVPRHITQAVLADPSGEALAVFCRGLKLNRAIFSAIALLRAPAPMPLEAFDNVADRAAARLVHDWRKRMEPVVEEIAAAE